MVSTAPSSTAFDHAALDSEVRHMTIGATVQVTAAGVSATGNPVELPEGATWAVSDSSVISISEEGLVTALANGKADVNLVVSAAGYGAAKVLYERFGMPYAIGVPVGNELPGLLADQIILNVKKLREQPDGAFGKTFEAAEISVDSGMFPDGSAGKGGSTYEKGFAAVIGEGITSLSIASSIELECGIPAKVLCATECPEGILRECDRMTPDEDDIIPELKGAAYVIADPLYKPIVPESAKFISLPSEAFSGRIYRDEIPDLVSDFDSLLQKLD
jgi:hypothetical protein